MDNKFSLLNPTLASLYGFLFLTFVAHAVASPLYNMIELEEGNEQPSSKAKLTLLKARQEVENCESKKERIITPKSFPFSPLSVINPLQDKGMRSSHKGKHI